MRILVIDDSPDDRETILRCLQKAEGLGGADLVEAESAEEGLAQLRQDAFDCVLIDFSMPGASGLDLLEDISVRYPDLPMVMITGSGNEKVAVSALKGGASDYVSKGDISTETLAQAIGQALEKKQAEVAILRNANTDELTGLPNRRAFNERLTYLERRAVRHKISYGIAYMDLDGLKRINDTHGHEAGDALLAEAASRLADSLRQSDMLARIGGDEFVVILEDLDPAATEPPQAMLERFVLAIDGAPFELPCGQVQAGISIGVALYPQMAETAADLVRLADEAMFANKQARKRAAGMDPGER
ncbi:MAG: diguanylate cyclase [Sneathiellaceae bacterium]